MTVKAVELRAELRQVKTMADFTVNVTLNLPEDCREQVKVLLDWLGDEIGLVLVNDRINGVETDDTRRQGQVRTGQSRRRQKAQTD